MDPIEGHAVATRGILLASDLGPRSDRALDRAVQLAQAWNTRLVVCHVVERNAAGAREMTLRDPPDWYRAEDPLHAAERHLLEDASARGVRITLRVERGDAGERLLEVAREEGCGLLVTGVARQESLGRIVLGSTVDWLVRRSPIPVLVVRGRAHGPYRRMVVASDWSPPTERALRTATALFPAAAVSVLHGFELPMAGLMDSARDDMLAAARERASADGSDFIERCRPPGGAGSVSLVVERSDPAQLMRIYTEQFRADLAVVASQGRTALLDMMLGSIAQRLVEESPVDTLVVRGPRASAR